MNKKYKLLKKLDAMDKEKYSREELFPEMLRLKEQLVNMVFGSTNEKYQMVDIYNELQLRNEKAGFPANKELNEYRKLSRKFYEEIKGYKRGTEGENLAYYALKNMKSDHVVLRNIELDDEENHTEIDLLVIKKGIVTIVEVKNTNLNAFINSNGYYLKCKGYNKCVDCNLGSKMKLREEMIRKILDKNGFEDMKIKQVVVFTKNIQIHDEYDGFETCYLSNLAYTIDDFYSSKIQFIHELEKVASAIEIEVENTKYSTDVDIQKLKETFVEVLVKIEESNKPFNILINKIKHYFDQSFKDNAYIRRYVRS